MSEDTYKGTRLADSKKTYSLDPKKFNELDTKSDEFKDINISHSKSQKSIPPALFSMELFEEPRVYIPPEEPKYVCHCCSDNVQINPRHIEPVSDYSVCIK